jgi:hypothetical protein
MLRWRGIRDPVIISKVLRISGRLLSKTIGGAVDERYAMKLRETSIQPSNRYWLRRFRITHGVTTYTTT